MVAFRSLVDVYAVSIQVSGSRLAGFLSGIAVKSTSTESWIAMAICYSVTKKLNYEEKYPRRLHAVKMSTAIVTFYVLS